MQAPVAAGFKHPSELAGKRIVTSFPNVTKKYFAQFEKDGEHTGKFALFYHAQLIDPSNCCTLIVIIIGIKYVSGSVEAACGLGLADAIVDLVETGTTMRVSLLLESLSCRCVAH